MTALKILIVLLLFTTVIPLKKSSDNCSISDGNYFYNIHVSPIRDQRDPDATKMIATLQKSVAEINSQMQSLLLRQTAILHQSEANEQRIKYLETTLETLRKKPSVTSATTTSSTAPMPTTDPCNINKLDINEACPEGFIYGQFCYIFSRFRTTWALANRYCKELGAYQVQINDEHMGTYLSWKIRREESMPVKFRDSYWIGAKKDKNNKSKWTWFPSDLNLSYFNWANVRQYKDKKGYDCVGMEVLSGEWTDLYCTYVYKFICQRTYSPKNNTCT